MYSKLYICVYIYMYILYVFQNASSDGDYGVDTGYREWSWISSMCYCYS